MSTNIFNIKMVYSNKEILLQLDSENREEIMDAVGLLNVCTNLFFTSPDVDSALNLIAKKTVYDRTLRTAEGEYVFIYEILPSDTFDNELDLIFKMTNNVNFFNKQNFVLNDLIKDISSKIDIKVDIVDNSTNIYKIAEFIENNNCSDQFPKYFNYVDYPWFDPINLNIILKRAYSVKLIKDNREFVIGTGFTLKDKPEELRIKEKNNIRNRILIFTVSFLLFLGILYLFGGQKLIFRNYNWIYAISIAIVISTLSALSYSTPGTFEKELNEQSQLNVSILTIASISIAIAILIINTSAVYKSFSNEIFINMTILGFVFSLSALILPIFNNTGPNVSFVITVQRILKNMGIGFLFYGIIAIILPNIKVNEYKK